MRPFFCASSQVAQQMSDEEFWDNVFPGPELGEEEDVGGYLDTHYLWPEDTDAGFDELLEGYNIITANGQTIIYIRPDNICPVCGSSTACGYDDAGRAMIHALPQEE